MNDTIAQQKIERKIIIDKGLFYYFTVDDETQLATLHKGSIADKLSIAKKYPMPIGRETTEPFNPLAFDIKGDEMIGINWILNSNNSRYEAIKAINLKNWEKPHADWALEQWAQVSFDQPNIAPNEPWENMLAANNILSNTFFDIILTDKLVMGVSNQNKFWLYNYDGTTWGKMILADVKFAQYFSLINQKEKIGIVDAMGNIFQINTNKNTIDLKRKSIDEQPKILIIDKDENKNYTINLTALHATENDKKSLNQIIKESATEITF